MLVLTVSPFLYQYLSIQTLSVIVITVEPYSKEVSLQLFAGKMKSLKIERKEDNTEDFNEESCQRSIHIIIEPLQNH